MKPSSKEMLLAMLTGKCPHEIQAEKVTGLLAMLAFRQPENRLEIPLASAEELDGYSVSIQFGPTSATVELVFTGSGDSTGMAAHPTQQ